jgi:hypothetical protein
MDSEDFDIDKGEAATIRSMPLPTETHSSIRRRLMLVAVLFVGWLALCDLAIVPLSWYIKPNDAGAIVMFVIMGCFASQFGMLPVWLVWGCCPYWFRIVTGWGAAAVLGSLWAAGSLLANRIAHRELDYEVLAVVLLWPLLSLGIETPLWCLKTIFGGRITRPVAASERPLAIGDLMIATAITATALTLARIAKLSAGEASDAEYWGVIGMICGICSSIGLVLLPLLGFVATRIRSCGITLVATSLVAALVGVSLATLGYLMRGMPPTGWYGLWGVVTAGASFTTSLAIPFLWARWLGFRFQFGKNSA